MKLFHFYIDSDESKSHHHDNLLFPFCRTSRGYGIFYWGFRGGEIIKIDSRDAIEPKGWFENGNSSILNYDNNMGRWGKNKLVPVDDPKCVKFAIQQIFESDDMYQTMKMWSKS